MIRCIIIEDERLAQDVIKSHLQKAGRFNLIGTFRTAPEAKEVIDKEEVDLIFLDIQLPGMTGLNFLRSLSNPPLVVFTTSYPEYALESYEFNVIDYLLKPISFERFSKTIDKIMDGKIFKSDITSAHFVASSSFSSTTFSVPLHFSSTFFTPQVSVYSSQFCLATRVCVCTRC